MSLLSVLVLSVYLEGCPEKEIPLCTLSRRFLGGLQPPHYIPQQPLDSGPTEECYSGLRSANGELHVPRATGSSLPVDSGNIITARLFLLKDGD